ncbi:MAG: Cys-tRNA(Pro) deacylase [Clostridia bacterium]|nr:Cys-tRNA(Pro) deacylase [Clostridia bacterium]
MAKIVKTNAMRYLEKNNIEHNVITYESDGFMDGVSIAEKLNQPLEKTFKTLVTVGKSKTHYVFVVPVAEELNLKKAASIVGEKSIEMISVKDINAITGYIRGGCSPLGMKKQFRTIVHISALNQNKILFSAGRLGAQIEMAPSLLKELINAEFEDIII